MKFSLSANTYFSPGETDSNNNRLPHVAVHSETDLLSLIEDVRQVKWGMVSAAEILKRLSESGVILNASHPALTDCRLIAEMEKLDTSTPQVPKKNSWKGKVLSLFGPTEDISQMEQKSERRIELVTLMNNFIERGLLCSEAVLLEGAATGIGSVAWYPCYVLRTTTLGVSLLESLLLEERKTA